MKTDKQKPGLRRTLSNLLFLLRPWWRYGKLLALGMILTESVFLTLSMALSIKLPQAVIDKIETGRPFNEVLLTAAAYLVAMLVCNVLNTWYNADYYPRKIPYVSGRIERSIYEHALTVDSIHLDSPDFYDSYKLATEQFVTKAYDAVYRTSMVVSIFVQIITCAAIIFVNAPPIITVVIVFGVISALLQVRWGKAAAERNKRAVKPRRRMDYIRRLLFQKSVQADLRSNTVRAPLLHTYDTATAEITKNNKTFIRKEFFTDVGTWLCSNLPTVTVLIYVAWALTSGKLEGIGVYATLIAATEKLRNLSETIGWCFAMTAELSAYAEQVRAFFEIKSDIEPQTTGAAPPDGAFSLALRGVSFTYPNADFGLKNLNISIAPGEKIAIVGENGAGKTTLSKLLLRLYDIGSGEILYNGKSIRDYNIHALRRKIGVAFQDPQLYALTVRENMCVYNKSDDETLRAVLKTVGLDLDLDAEVTREFDESGVMLSGGEAQKLALARLLHGDFGLLLLDEPSSALDPIAEYEMTKLMFERSRTTTIMVAHRLSTIRSADRIYLIADGEVAEQGTHDELIALGGKYAEMFNKQAENYVR
jgi:ATP-binding cassette subfamily B protein